MASRNVFESISRGMKWTYGHASEVLAFGAAGGATISCAFYARARQRALEQARRQFSSKSNGSSSAVANAAEVETASATRKVAAATANKVVSKGSMRTYSPTEMFALALWHG